MRKGDLVKKHTTQEQGIIVAIGRETACVLWGDGLHSEGPLSDLESINFRPGADITANFIEMVDQVYPDHMAWLKEGSPGSGRFA